MRSRTRVILQLLLLLGLAAPATAVARTISWSGYRWDVRPTGVGGPGANLWSDSPAGVHTDGSDLVLSTVRDASGCWTSAEVDSRRHLGYGTYRWIVASDLSGLDAGEVLGLFTYGGSAPSNNEIDIEASHWGHPAWPSGSVTVWQDAAAERSRSMSFRYSNRPPYVNQFTWEPGRVSYLVTDAAGAVLLDRVVTRGVPRPSTEVPVINYWRYGRTRPRGRRSMRISSFTWIPPGGDVTPPLIGGLAVPSAWEAADGASGEGASAPGCVRVALSPRRFSAAHGTTIRWMATVKARLGMRIERRSAGRRFITVRALDRTVRRGDRRVRIDGHRPRRGGDGRVRIDGHRLRRGSYRLVVVAHTGSHSRRSTLAFSVRGR